MFPVAVNDKYSLNEDIVFSGRSLEQNDFNFDAVVSVKNSAGKVTRIVGDSESDLVDVDSSSGGTFSVAPDGSFTYDPRKAFNFLAKGEEATETFRYKIRNAGGQKSRFADVTFTIQGRNDRPQATDDKATIDEAGVFDANILANDIDADNSDTFTVSDFAFAEFKKNGQSINSTAIPLMFDGFSQEQAISGVGNRKPDYSISIDENGNVAFTPGKSIEQLLDAGDVGEITFTYKIKDDAGSGDSESEEATLTITIDGLDPAPKVFGKKATLFVDPNTNKITGKGSFEGDDYEGAGRLLSSTTDNGTNPNDAIAGTSGNDNIWAGLQGNDRVVSGAGDDIVGIRNGKVETQDGDDYVYSTAEGGILDINLGGGFNKLWTLADVSKTKAGDSGGHYGFSDGNDTLKTGKGDDFVYSIDGKPQGGIKTINLGGGNNTISLGDTISTSIKTGRGKDNIALAGGVHNIKTGGGEDIIFIASGDGDDIINAGGGNDTIEIADTKDIVNGGGGNDTVKAGGGNDDINGDDGDDLLYGEAGDDSINGGKGDDLLFGGAGLNVLTGGNDPNLSDADTFVLSIGGHQVITDFILEEDKIGLATGLRFEDLEFMQLGISGSSSLSLRILSAGETIGDVQNISTLASARLQTDEIFYTNV